MKHNPSSFFTRVPQTVFVSVFFRLQIIYHCYRNRSINLGSTYGIYNTEARPIGSCNRTSSFHSVQFGWWWNSPITCGFFSHDHICAAFVLRRVVVYFVKLISPWTKWSPFRRRSFQMHCLNWGPIVLTLSDAVASLLTNGNATFWWKLPYHLVYSSPPGENGRYFANNIFKCIFMNEKFCILIKILLKFVPKGLINSNTALV